MLFAIFNRRQEGDSKPVIEFIKCVNDDVYTAGFFNFWLIFCLGWALAVVAPLDFDFNGFALDCGGDIGGAFGHGGGNVFDWADLFAVAEDVGIGFAGVDGAAGYWYELCLTTR